MQVIEGQQLYVDGTARLVVAVAVAVAMVVALLGVEAGIAATSAPTVASPAAAASTRRGTRFFCGVADIGPLVSSAGGSKVMTSLETSCAA